ncbi:venom acid phosphatase Acph-1 isoform X1 [Scaptodrosophila lebanonensis]|uniref:Venom acid phosphatase Acph-1 isoform X1 n=2 Tax=Drosophila lebanonensis TaxID=7225 RepID=A0A6J2UIN3_DROLE|nr:venom acid phosphatase Acph-1 isoform X1 [Scaptodrosophila lebanonensis]
MPRSHSNRKHCLAMTGGLIAVALLILCFTHSTVNSGKLNDPGTDESTLELLHVVFRHGPRTPADTYPKDPYVNETYYPFGWGQVTNNGKRELFNIGTWLRKRYGKFLAPYYSPDLVHAQATGVPRTHMTLQTVLASFFPPKGTPMEWNSKYNWQPIPIFSQALDEDTLLLVRTPCPRYFEALHEVYELPEVKAEAEPYLEMYKELEAHTGLSFKEPEDVQSLYLTLLAEQEWGLELPEWTKEYFPEKMQFLTEQSYVYNVYTPEMQKIKAGPFLRKMFDEMQQKRNSTIKPEKRKLFIYTGHDSTVVNILSALNIWERQLPRYSVMALFELHKNKETGDYWIEIYFRNNPKAPAQKLTVPGCEFQCPLDKLLELAKDVLPTQADDNRCDSKNEEFTEPPLRGP